LSSKLSTPPVLADTVVHSVVIASNEIACKAVVMEANNAGVEITCYGQALFGDVFEKANELALILKQAKSGLYVWGGETTLTLPDAPGRGGRNQSLALALALEIENIPGLTVLVAATDGSDGPTEDAGAIIDGFTIKRGEQYAGQAAECLSAANAGYFLQEAGDLISTGPTGTNVMDLVIAFKE
ncbi:MAG: hydroxypyruvate reductase, partial [Gammaproteobacteria bacterium]|nr:hydroxypyruvate reductase [Gammaproteobacteria bacterium]